MEKVYCVFQCVNKHDENWWLLGVYSTYEIAREKVSKEGLHWIGYKIEEFALDDD